MNSKLCESRMPNLLSHKTQKCLKPTLSSIVISQTYCSNNPSVNIFCQWLLLFGVLHGYDAHCLLQVPSIRSWSQISFQVLILLLLFLFFIIILTVTNYYFLGLLFWVGIFFLLCCTELLEELFCFLFIFLCISVVFLFGLKIKDTLDSLKADITINTDNV